MKSLRTSLMLLAAVRGLIPLLLLYAVFLLWRGHNAPGGGFVGGLVAAAAFVLYSLTAGLEAGRRALRVDPSSLLSSGLGIALISGIPGLLLGGPFMSAVWVELQVGALRVPFGTPLLFDIGVFLAVTGVVLTIVFTLAETAFTES
ncbi:MAG TPA: Na+/H+ antiporter subunit B [Longimicrobiaceae bacterium]